MPIRAVDVDPERLEKTGRSPPRTQPARPRGAKRLNYAAATLGIKVRLSSTFWTPVTLLTRTSKARR
jgi:hypothetical protein